MNLPTITTPTFKLTVPSTKQEVTMKLMQVKDEKVLLMAKEGNDTGEILASVKQVVQNCLVAPALSVDDLSIFDVEYMFLQLRSHSISDKTEVSYIDNDEVDTFMAEYPEGLKELTSAPEMTAAQRKATHTFTINLNEVEVKFPENKENNIKISDKAGIILKYPPASLYSDKEFMEATGEKVVDLLIQKSIQTIYDGEKQTDIGKPEKTVDLMEQNKNRNDLKEWIDNLDVKVYNKVKEFFSDLPHLHYEIKYTNKNGKDRTITLTTLNDFFSL